MKMFFLGLLVTFTGVTVFAGGLKITSFVLTPGTHLADLCGNLSPAPTGPTAVQVIVDPQYKTEAHYNTLVGSDGNFCITVTTYAGRADLTPLK